MPGAVSLAGHTCPVLFVHQDAGGITRGAAFGRFHKSLVYNFLGVDDASPDLVPDRAGRVEQVTLERTPMVEGQQVERSVIS